jgi:hypothetical protein
MKKQITLGLFCLFIVSHWPLTSHCQQVKPKMIYQVPTSGEIIDVVYRIEFDEWWIKCREGDGIVVYTFDREDKVWGMVRFEPKKGESVPKNPEPAKKEQIKPNSRESGSKESQKNTDIKKDPAKAPDKKDEDKDRGAPEKRGEAKEKDNKKSEEKAKQPWWDPFNILNKGKKLVNPEKDAGRSDMPPIEPHKPEK